MSLDVLLKNKIVSVQCHDGIKVKVGDAKMIRYDTEDWLDVFPVVGNWSGVTLFTYYKGRTMMVRNNITCQNSDPLESPENFLKRTGVL